MKDVGSLSRGERNEVFCGFANAAPSKMADGFLRGPVVNAAPENGEAR